MANEVEIPRELERSDQIRSRISRYKRVVRGFWWIPAITVSLGLAYQGWQSLTKPVSYQSTARVLVSGRIAIPESGMFTEEAVNFFGTQVELMQSQEVRRRAAARVQSLRPDLVASPVSIEVMQIPRTSIFILRASGTQPDYVKAFLNALLDEYIALRRGIFAEKSQSTLSAITDQLAEVEKELRRNEADLVEWKSSNNLVFLQESGASAGSYLTQLNRNLANLESEYNLTTQLTDEQNFDRTASARPPETAVPRNGSNDAPSEDEKDFFLTAEGGAAENYLSVKRALSVLRAQREQLIEVNKPDHPKVRAIDKQIGSNEKILEIFRAQASEQLESRRQAIAVQITNTKKQIQEWEVKALDLSRRMGEFERLRDKVDRTKALYNRLLSSVQRVDVNANIQQDILSVNEYATPPTIRIQPLAKDLATGALVGLLLGAGILLIIAALDDRVVSVNELQALLGQEVVGIIPLVPEGQQYLHLDEDDNPGILEAFRKVRSWLLFTEWEKGPPKSIMVTSSMPGEGKSTLAYNMALCFAASSMKTLLVDADLRRGSLHRLLKVDQDPGLGNILDGEVTVAKAVRRTEHDNLSVLPRGFYGMKGSDTFLGASVDHFLSEIEKQYDVVIFDSSPALATDETSVLAGKVDAVLIAVRSGVTSLRLAKRTMSHIGSRGAAVEGIIYNGLSTSDHEYPYYNYYYYSHADKPSRAERLKK